MWASPYNLLLKLDITRKLKIYCQLVRLPNIFTSTSDILAGCILATHAFIDIHKIILLVFISACLYGGGIVFNDVFDITTDETERPDRPLPSGNISKRDALYLGVILFLTALLCACLVNATSVCISIVIIALIMSYNTWTKTVPAIGTLNMGLCRFFNLMLGLSIIPASISTYWMFPLILMIYVMLITALSKQEVKGEQRWKIVFVISCFIGLVFFTGSLSVKGILPNHAMHGLLFIFTLIVLWPMGKAVINPCPKSIQSTIKTMVLSIIILDACFVMGATNGLHALVVLALLVPASIISRFLYVT